MSTSPQSPKPEVPPGGWDRPAVGQPPPPGSYRLADWLSRVAAAIIDGLIVAVPATLLALLIVFGFANADSTGGIVGAIVASLLSVLVVALVALFYAPLFMMRPGARNGQTLGKQLLGIRVIRTNGEPFDFWLGAFREVLIKGLAVGIASTVIPFVPYVLDSLWPLWDDENRALHDFVASTRVVKA
jgi:uncharacterized RDD family membrane protein YckC